MDEKIISTSENYQLGCDLDLIKLTRAFLETGIYLKKKKTEREDFKHYTFFA